MSRAVRRILAVVAVIGVVATLAAVAVRSLMGRIELPIAKIVH